MLVGDDIYMAVPFATSTSLTGNVYGGGNNAEVTGNTNVVIGAQ